MPFLQQGIKNYDSALNEMAEDIAALRRRVLTVEAENQLLRTEASLRQGLGHNLVAHRDVTAVAKVEVAHLIGRQYLPIIQLRFSLEIQGMMD